MNAPLPAGAPAEFAMSMPPLRRVSRFALIGILSTLIYAAVAFALSGRVLSPVAGSFAAYLVSASFSYAGHKYVTFVSGGKHALELPRFLALGAFGLVLALALPALLTDWAGLPPWVPILVICVAVPAVNYLVMDRWVFRRG